MSDFTKNNSTDTEALVNSFLANGGKIERIPEGKRSVLKIFGTILEIKRSMYSTEDAALCSLLVRKDEGDTVEIFIKEIIALKLSEGGRYFMRCTYNSDCMQGDITKLTTNNARKLAALSVSKNPSPI